MRTRSFVQLFAVGLFTVSISNTAWAEAEASPKKDADQQALQGKKGNATVYSFEDDSIEGEVLSPIGENLQSRKPGTHGSLITVRHHFIPQLIKMARDV